MLFQRRDPLKRLPGFHPRPVCFELPPVQRDPTFDPAPGGFRSQCASGDNPVETEDCVITLMLGVEVRRLVFLVEHADYDAEEA